MSSFARASQSAWISVLAWWSAQGGLPGLAAQLRPPRRAADELAEARELLAYWEQRARRLPRWALMRRREARGSARAWRERVRAAECERYGPGVLGAASQYALERRMPAEVAHRGRQVVRAAGYAVAVMVLTLLAVLVAALATVADIVL